MDLFRSEEMQLMQVRFLVIVIFDFVLKYQIEFFK